MATKVYKISKKRLEQREQMRTEGVKKSWKQARTLHNSSSNHRSTPAVARSFLSAITTEGKSNQQILQEYDTFIDGYKSQRKRRRRTTTRRMSNIRPSTTPVDQLILVRNFMRTNSITTKQLKHLVESLERIQSS